MTILDPAPSPHSVLAVPPGPYRYVPRQPVPDPSPPEQCDAAVADLRAAADRWVRTSPERKRDLLDEVLHATEPLIGAWTRIGSLHEGLDPTGPDAAEETIVGPYVFMRGVRLHRRAIDGIITRGAPRIPGGVRTLPDGRVAARVMPSDWLDTLAYLGTTADVPSTGSIPRRSCSDPRATANCRGC